MRLKIREYRQMKILYQKKKDGVLHGYGMKNIRDIVEQYNGMFQCKSQEDRFEVVITIYG